MRDFLASLGMRDFRRGPETCRFIWSTALVTSLWKLTYIYCSCQTKKNNFPPKVTCQTYSEAYPPWTFTHFSDQQWCSRPHCLLRDHRGHLPRPERHPPRQPRPPGALRRRRRSSHCRRRPHTWRRVASLRDGLSGTDDSPGQRRRDRRASSGGGSHVPPPEGCSRADIQEHREELGGGVWTFGYLWLDFSFLDRSSGQAGDPRSGRGEGGVEGWEAVGDEACVERVWEHVECLRTVYIGWNEEVCWRRM